MSAYRMLYNVPSSMPQSGQSYSQPADRRTQDQNTGPYENSLRKKLAGLAWEF